MNKFVIGSVILALTITPVLANVYIEVNKKTQKMYVVSDEYVNEFKVSTARKGFDTPVGTFHPYSLERMHYSHKYNMSPMYNTIFFKKGWAIHGTNEERKLGKPASHGCVRLSKVNSKILYNLVKNDPNVTIVIK